ncbi:MAG: sugar phosphate isomerase/epimerase [Hadesarchaea archaeon]|nr:sugar phosphate isomerase/epimerase [Hadesarchaea archaeon]
MKIGRNFTNLLYIDYLNQEKREKVLSGEMAVHDMDAIVQVEEKKDIPGKIRAAEKSNINHVELDGAVPNPYLDFTEEQKEKARNAQAASDVSLSFHLPYTYIAECMCAPEEQDRQIATELQKRYIEFASEIGCEYCNAHPGVVPFYHATGKYLEKVQDNLVKSLKELGQLAMEKGIKFHIENNTAFDSIFVEPEELIEVVREVREEGIEIFFNFDIGHWFTRADNGKEIPSPPEEIVNEIPGEMIKELHLNDYIPGKKIFHPPLHEERGLLVRENLERYAEIVKSKETELIVLETAFRETKQVKNRDEILQKETEYVKEILGLS